MSLEHIASRERHAKNDMSTHEPVNSCSDESGDVCFQALFTLFSTAVKKAVWEGLGMRLMHVTLKDTG